jgi:hypothetical protein
MLIGLYFTLVPHSLWCPRQRWTPLFVSTKLGPTERRKSSTDFAVWVPPIHIEPTWSWSTRAVRDRDRIANAHVLRRWIKSHGGRGKIDGSLATWMGDIVCAQWRHRMPTLDASAPSTNPTRHIFVGRGKCLRTCADAQRLETWYVPAHWSRTTTRLWAMQCNVAVLPVVLVAVLDETTLPWTMVSRCRGLGNALHEQCALRYSICCWCRCKYKRMECSIPKRHFPGTNVIWHTKRLRRMGQAAPIHFPASLESRPECLGGLCRARVCGGGSNTVLVLVVLDQIQAAHTQCHCNRSRAVSWVSSNKRLRRAQRQGCGETSLETARWERENATMGCSVG